MATLAWRDPVTSCTTIACTSSRRHHGTRMIYYMQYCICSILHMIHIHTCMLICNGVIHWWICHDFVRCGDGIARVWSFDLARIARIYDISWQLVYWIYWLWTKVLKRSKRTPAPAKPKGSEAWLLWSADCCKEKTGFLPYCLRRTKSLTYWLSTSIPEDNIQSFVQSINLSIHPSSNQCHIEYCNKQPTQIIRDRDVYAVCVGCVLWFAAMVCVVVLICLTWCLLLCFCNIYIYMCVCESVLLCFEWRVSGMQIGL